MYQEVRKLERERHKLLAEARTKWAEYEDCEDRSSDSASEIKSEYDRIWTDYEATDEKLRTAEADWREGLRLRDEETRNLDLARDLDRLGNPEEVRDPNAPILDDSSQGDFTDSEEYRQAYFSNLLAEDPRDLPIESRQILARGREQRASLTTAVSSNVGGGNLIPTGFLARLIEEMKFTGPMVPGGGLCFDFPTPGGNPIDLPTLDDTDHTGEPTPLEAKRIDESKSTGGTDIVNDSEVPDFRKVTFGATMYDSMFIKVTVEMLQDSGIPGLENILAMLGGQRLGRRINSVFTAGTKGINTLIPAARTNTSASTTEVTIEELRGLVHKIDPAYRGGTARGAPSNRTLTWMFNDDTFEKLVNLKLPFAGTKAEGYTTVQYAFQLSNDMLNGEPSRLLGRPFAINQAMENIATGKKPIIVGDFRNAWIRAAGPMRSVVARERFIERLLVGWLVYRRVDMKVVNTSTFAMLKMK